LSPAETISTDTGLAVKDTDVNTPSRGMTMDQVASKFGSPASKITPVGKPPISRWEYPGFVVYFEHEHVIHSVVAASSSGAAAPSNGESAPSGGGETAPSSGEAAPVAGDAPPAGGEVAASSAPATSSN
jgi:hypothetical protein